MQEQTAFDRKLKVSDLDKKPLQMQIKADLTECSAIADQFQLESVQDYIATLTVRLQGRDDYHITGQIDAEVTQLCGISLSPVTYHLSETVDVLFSTNPDRWEQEIDLEKEPEKAVELSNFIDEEAVEPADPVIDGYIDLGRLLMEYFSLGLNPYVRASDAPFSMPDQMVKDLEKASPFAKLSEIKINGKGTKD